MSAFFRDIFSQNLLANQNRGIVCIIIPLMVKCMHDIAGHIDNVLVELPHHLKIDDKQKVNEILKVYNVEKDKKRCCKILLHLTVFVSQNTLAF